MPRYSTGVKRVCPTLASFLLKALAPHHTPTITAPILRAVGASLTRTPNARQTNAIKINGMLILSSHKQIRYIPKDYPKTMSPPTAIT